MPFATKIIILMLTFCGNAARAAEIRDVGVRLSERSWSDLDPSSCEPRGWGAREKDLVVAGSSFDIAHFSFGKNVTIHDFTITGGPGEKVGVTIPIPLVRAAFICEAGGRRASFRNSIETGGIFVYEATIPEDGRLGLRIAVYSDAGPMSPVVLASPFDVARPLLGATIYWVLIGGMIAVCLYNLFFWLGAKKELYRINFVYVFSMLVFNLVVGRGSMVLLEILREQGIEALALVRLLNSLNNATAIWTAGYVLYFSTIVVNLQSELPGLNQLLKRVFGAMITIAITSLVYVFLTNDVQKITPIARYAGSIAVLATLSHLIYLSFIRKHFFARLFVMSYLPLCVCTLIFVSYLEGNIIANAFTRNSLAIGSFLESLLLSFTIGYRMKLIELDALQKSEEFTKRLSAVNDELERKVLSHVGDIRAMLENIRQAVFMIEADAKGDLWISEEKSNFTHYIFALDDPKGRIPLGLILDQLRIPDEQKSYLVSIAVSSLGEERFAFEVNERCYPRRARAENGRELELLLYPVTGADGLTTRLLCAITDITEKLQTEALLAKNDLENRIMLEILKQPLQKAHKNIRILEKALMGNPGDAGSSGVMRCLHTAKGIARVVFYDTLSQTIHALEEALLERSILPELALEQATEALHEYKEIYSKRLDTGSSLQNFANPAEPERVSEFMGQFENDIQRMALLLKKMPCLIEVENDRSICLEENELSALFGIMTHLIRNSLDHGIESAEERSGKGKPENGTVTIVVRNSERGSLHFDFRDDGRGIDLERLRAKAGRTGGIPEKQDELLDILFESGFSAKEEATMISGRGVGLDAVREVAMGQGGYARARLGRPLGSGFYEIIFEIQIGSLVKELDNGKRQTA